jgi:hypothetical protein
MITKKKEAQEQLELYKQVFAKIIGKECTVKFDMHEVDGFIVTDIKLQTLAGVKNKPAKVEYEGKNKSPMMFVIENNQAPLIFLFDSTLIAPLSNGVRITVPLEKPLNGKSVVEIDIRVTG